MSTVSVVVPAHNEERVIGRLLAELTHPEGLADLEILVVANACSDKTVAIAESFGNPIRVISIPTASKREALAAGNREARGFPRIYVDADVELGLDDVQALTAALRNPGIMAATPQLTHSMQGCSWLVRWYYDVWSQLPRVQDGLFGRGVFAVSREGYARIADLPPMLADDLVASLAFSPAERTVAPDARVVVRPPRTFKDLIRVRTRAAIGVSQVERTAGAPTSTARTQVSDLVSIVMRKPRTAPRVALFLAVAVLSRFQARRAVQRSDYTTWLRDDSSRG